MYISILFDTKIVSKELCFIFVAISDAVYVNLTNANASTIFVKDSTTKSESSPGDKEKIDKIPPKLKAVIKFGYDEGMKNRLSRQDFQFETWIEGVLTHTQAHFRHPSLGTVIEFEVCLFLIFLPKYSGETINYHASWKCPLSCISYPYAKMLGSRIPNI